MYAQKILFATDFSEHSEAAGLYAAGLARDSGAKLLVVHVVQPPTPYGAAGPFVDTFVNHDHSLFQQMLEEAVPSSDAVAGESHLLSGNPAAEIVRFADENDVDLIVLGTHGRTGAARLLMGSVAETVVRRASCPVLTIRNPHKLKTDEQP
jgi:nucleotide-binding universal stress UspA family protein